MIKSPYCTFQFGKETCDKCGASYNASPGICPRGFGANFIEERLEQLREAAQEVCSALEKDADGFTSLRPDVKKALDELASKAGCIHVNWWKSNRSE